MKKVDTSQVSTTIGMPVKSGTLAHIQAAYLEAIAGVAQNIIGPNPLINTVYVLNGCVNTGSGSNYVISAGVVYYNGEVYLVDAVSFTAGGGQTAVANIAITYFSDPSADPVTFTDGNPRNIHIVRKIAIASANTGTGIADFANFKQTQLVLNNILSPATISNPYTIKFDQDYAIFFGTLTVDANFVFDFTNAIPGAVTRVKFAFGAGRAISVTGSGSSTIVKDSGDASIVSNNTNVIYFIYLGKNDLGKDEVSWNLKQTA